MISNQKEILLIGGGGHCRSVIDVLEMEGKYKVGGIIDQEDLIGNKVFNYEIIGCDNDLKKLSSNYKNALVTVGQIKSPDIRIKLFSFLKSIGYYLPVIISPLAYVSRYSEIEEGTIVMHHALVNAGARVGKNCIINSKALIEHDSIIEDNCHISTGAIINGGVTIKKNTFFGSNAVSQDHTESYENDFIAANSLLKRNRKV